MDAKIEEADDEEKEELEVKAKALKSKAKKAKKIKSSTKCDPEIIEAINSGKSKADAKVLDEDTVTDTVKGSSEAPEAEESEPAAKATADETVAEAQNEETEPSTMGEQRAQKMRNYFRKSNIVNAYNKEKEEELQENQKIIAT